MRFQSIASARKAYLAKKIDKFEYDAILLGKALEQMSAEALERAKSPGPVGVPQRRPIRRTADPGC